VSTIGATSGASGTAGTFTVNSVISGTGDVNISNNSSTGGGRGLLILGGQSTYTGNTMIDANAPDGFSAVSANVQLAVSNALPTSTGLIYGTRSGVGAAVIDLNGFNQQVAFVGDGGQFVAGTKFLTITNLGSGTSTFTINGSTAATFGGVLTNSGSGKLNFVKNGAGTQTLTAVNTYTGNTTISGGTLALSGSGSIGFSPSISVGTGATLDVSGVTGGFTVANGQTLSGNGTVSGGMTLGNGSTIAPGTVGTAGTLTTGNLTLSGGATY
jgi:autotransporter-associated beta strand protein